MFSSHLSWSAGPRPSLRLLREFRLFVARAAERRAVAHLDAHLRRDIGLPETPEFWPGTVERRR